MESRRIDKLLSNDQNDVEKEVKKEKEARKESALLIDRFVINYYMKI